MLQTHNNKWVKARKIFLNFNTRTIFVYFKIIHTGQNYLTPHTKEKKAFVMHSWNRRPNNKWRMLNNELMRKWDSQRKL